MGQLLERFGFRKSSVFTEENILEYESLTYLNRMEIIKAYYRFCSYEPLYILGPKNPCYPLERVGELPEFHYNPFKDRMIKVFATSVDGYLTFEDYLDMLSVFSERAPMNLKAEYAFKIYDFDGDDLISMDDLEELLTRLLGTESYDIPDRDIREVLKTVLKDGDIDEDGNIAFTEFSHVLQRVSDFMKSFVITL